MTMADITGRKTGGRKKGTPNKSTALYSSMLKFVLSGHIDKLNQELNSLSGIKYIEAIIRIGKLLNVNNDRNYTYINELLADSIKRTIQSRK